MTAQPWTTGELQVLRSFAQLGPSVIAVLLDRTDDSVKNKAKELGISLAVTGIDVDVASLSTRMLTRIREVPGLQVCPMCGKRLASMRATGMCRCCHLDQLIALREEQLSEEIRLRRLTKLRQDKRRLRICESCGDAFYPRPTSTATTCPDCGGAE